MKPQTNTIIPPSKDIELRFDWSSFKADLVNGIPEKYQKDVSETFDLKKYFEIRVKQAEFIGALYRFPAVILMSPEMAKYKTIKFFENYDDYYSKIAKEIAVTKECVNKAHTEDSNQQKLQYKQCLSDSQRNYQSIYDEHLAFLNREIPYANPLKKLWEKISGQ